LWPLFCHFGRYFVILAVILSFWPMARTKQTAHRTASVEHARVEAGDGGYEYTEDEARDEYTEDKARDEYTEDTGHEDTGNEGHEDTGHEGHEDTGHEGHEEGHEDEELRKRQKMEDECRKTCKAFARMLKEQQKVTQAMALTTYTAAVNHIRNYLGDPMSALHPSDVMEKVGRIMHSTDYDDFVFRLGYLRGSGGRHQILPALPRKPKTLQDVEVIAEKNPTLINHLLTCDAWKKRQSQMKAQITKKRRREAL
jgi:hypothetical protein